MQEKSFLILPGCDDSNRGDQALIWETVELAKNAGYNGLYYMLGKGVECRQSKKKKINCIEYILKHPSEHYSLKDNIEYTQVLKIKWAMAAMLDFIKAEPLVHPFLRKLFLPLYRNKTKLTVDKFAAADAAFVKGGGFLHSYGGLSDIYKIYYFLYHIRLAQSYDVKIYILPNSFGPFKAPFVKSMVKKVLSKCECVMARESDSQEMLKLECGIEVKRYIDIAFHLNEVQNFDAIRLLRERGIMVQEKVCVGLTMRPYRFEGYPNGEKLYTAYKKSLANFIIWLSRHDYIPVLIEHVYSELKHEHDMSCIQDVVLEVGGKCEYKIFADHSLDCEQLKKVYGCFDYIVGTRFHSVIFSISQAVPCVAITYGGNKGNGIMTDLGLKEYIIPIEHIHFDKLRETFMKMVNNNKDIRKKIHEKLKVIEKEKVEIIKALEE